MQQWIFRHRAWLMALSGGLIIIAVVSQWLGSQPQIVKVWYWLAAIVGGTPIGLQAYQALQVRVISIELLVTIAMLGAAVINEASEAAIVAWLFLAGSWLEQRTLTKTRSAVNDLIALAPTMAWRQTTTGQFEQVAVDELKIGEIVQVKTGDQLPVDGQVIGGNGLVNEASLTGESMPVPKTTDNQVLAGSMLVDGTLQVRVEQIGATTVFGKIIELVTEAQDTKSAAERLIDRFAKYYTPAVLVAAVLTGLLTRQIELAVTILVLGCPGALVIGVPVSNVAGIGRGARQGILLKGSEVINQLSQLDTMVFDKTGTLTIGQPQVQQVKAYIDDPTPAIQALVSVEQGSNHPLAQAINQYYHDVSSQPVEQTQVVIGQGISATINGEPVLVGNQALLAAQQIPLTPAMQHDLATLTARGQSIVMVARGGQVELILGIADQLRPEAVGALAQLQQQGVKRLVVLSGDQPAAVAQIAQQLPLTQAYGGLLPDQKAGVIKQAQANGQTVAFVGDGINDSPALAQADLGIALGGGTGIALETAEMVLIHDDLAQLPVAIKLAKAIRANMIENIIIALAVVIVLLLSLFMSNWMNMAIGMLVHEASILVVILNGMRLLKK